MSEIARSSPKALTADLYDQQWRGLSDFIRFNPGSRHRRRIVLSLLNRISFRTLLDVGCGNAELIRMLRVHYGSDKSLTGSDLSPEVIRKNSDELVGTQFKVLDIQNQALNEQYDVVTCCEVVEHLEDRSRAISNLAKMVRPGGYLLITCPTGTVYATEKYFGHTTHPDALEIAEHAKNLGLEVVQSVNWGWPFYSALKWVTNIDSEWALKTFAHGDYSPIKKLVSILLYYGNFLNLRTPWGCQLFYLLRKPGT